MTRRSTVVDSCALLGAALAFMAACGGDTNGDLFERRDGSAAGGNGGVGAKGGSSGSSGKSGSGGSAGGSGAGASSGTGGSAGGSSTGGSAGGIGLGGNAGVGGVAGSGGSGASGGATDGGACPAQVPASGAPCSPEGQSCSYGQCCPVTAKCSGGHWSVLVPPCVAPICPTEQPKDGASCTPCRDAANCTYDRCSKIGDTVLAGCDATRATWRVTSSPCMIPCGPQGGPQAVVCTAEQVCVRRSGGPGFSYSCQQNPCSPAPLSCDCAKSVCGGSPFTCSIADAQHVNCDCLTCA